MSRNEKVSNLDFLTRQGLSACLFLACVCIAFKVSAGALPKGNCEDPKPYTDLRHCHFAGKDLRNKDLSGTDLRVEYLHGTQLQGSNLTKALFKRRDLMRAELDGAKGLPPEFLSAYANFKVFDNKNYLVTSKGKSNPSITLTPHQAVVGIQENIAGLASMDMFRRLENSSQTIALLDWPRHMDGPMMSIIARFDNDQEAVPACYQPVSLIAEQRYYYPGWSKMKVKSLGNKAYLIGVEADGGDGDSEGKTGWEKIVILRLSSACTLSVLYEEHVGWQEDHPDRKRRDCQGEHLDFDFVNDQTAVIKTTQHTCSFSPKGKVKITTKNINLK
jgi:hypothetical protein